MSLANNLVEELAQEYAEKRKRETSRRMGRYADDQFTPPSGVEAWAGSAGVGAEPFKPPATVRFNDLSYESTFPDAFPKVRFGPVDPETARLQAIDMGAPAGEPPFPGYERGARKAADVGGAVGGVVGQENVGRKVGEIGYRAIVPSTPAEFASAFATGGLFGETTVIGQAIRAQARKAGMRLEQYVASEEGRALVKKLGEETGSAKIPGSPDLPEPKPGAVSAQDLMAVGMSGRTAQAQLSKFDRLARGLDQLLDGSLDGMTVRLSDTRVGPIRERIEAVRASDEFQAFSEGTGTGKSVTFKRKPTTAASVADAAGVADDVPTLQRWLQTAQGTQQRLQRQIDARRKELRTAAASKKATIENAIKRDEQMLSAQRDHEMKVRGELDRRSLPKPGAEGAAGGMPASAADNLPPPTTFSYEQSAGSGTGAGFRGSARTTRTESVPADLPKAIKEAERTLAQAEKRLEKASQSRQALPPGSSRARLTTANANHSIYATARDNALERLAALKAIEPPATQIAPQPQLVDGTPSRGTPRTTGADRALAANQERIARAAAPEPPQRALGEAGGAEPPRGAEPPAGAGEPPTPPKRPVATGGGGELPPEKPPTIPEIEARSKPLTPDERAKLPRDQQEAIYVPRDFAEATTDTARAGEGPIGGTLQKIQDAAQKVPLIRSLFSFAEPMAGARAQTKLGNVIPEAMVRRAVYVANEREKAGVAFWKWMEDSRGTLDLDGKGVARGVGVKPGADIPASVRGRLDDIVEHPEDYVLSPEQGRAITQLRHTFNAVTQHQLDAGVDVRDVMGAYFPRIVKKSPKGAPKAKALRFTSKPGHAKPRAFTDLREGAAAGFEYINPIEAVQHRLDTGVESIGNRRTFEGIKELGQKPSERVPQSTRDAYLAAKEAYKSARTPENAAALDAAKRNLRVAATKANEPHIGEAKAFGRIFPEEVTNEIAKYVDIDDPGALDTFFRIQRATATSSDLSALLVQGGNLFWRNNIAWWKATGYSVAALAKAPMGYVSRNIDTINRGIDAGAIKRPSEFLLREGGGAVQQVGRVPIVKQAQRSFEWFVFVGQSEWWKATERLAKTPAERAELAAVIRKGTGSMLRPGLTKMQQRAEIGTFFAGKFLMAVNGLAADALRGGIRGQEARKTLGMVFGGATAMTIAGQLATDGTMPNLTDPSDRDKPWLSIKRPGGTVNFYGPLYPYLKAYASIGQNLANGKPSAAADDALFLGRTRLSIQYGTLIDFIEGKDAVGNEIDRSDPKSVAGYFARRSAPIGPKSLLEEGITTAINEKSVGAGIRKQITELKEFPEGLLQAEGGRANRATEFRQKVNAGEKFLSDANGDYRAAYDAAMQANDTAAADGIEYRWKQDLSPRLKEIGAYVVKGGPDENGILQKPRIEFEQWDRIEALTAKAIAEKQGVAGEYKTVADVRDAYVDRLLPAMLKLGKSDDEARALIKSDFNKLDAVKRVTAAKENYRLDQWRNHPDLLDEADMVGWERLNDKERRSLRQQAGDAKREYVQAEDEHDAERRDAQQC